MSWSIFAFREPRKDFRTCVRSDTRLTLMSTETTFALREQRTSTAGISG